MPLPRVCSALRRRTPSAVAPAPPPTARGAGRGRGGYCTSTVASAPRLRSTRVENCERASAGASLGGFKFDDDHTMAFNFRVLAFCFLAVYVRAPPPPSEPSKLHLLGTNISEVYFIGDLHGDDLCARRWVAQTGLVDLETEPWTWRGSSTDALVFMGDYVDKGPRSKQAAALVQKLTELFPKNCMGIIGKRNRTNRFA